MQYCCRSLRGSVDWNPSVCCASCCSCASLPSWERGLKSAISKRVPCRDRSLPSWERGLKLRWHCIGNMGIRRSLRGSVDWNLSNNSFRALTATSLPLWERGLKLYNKCEWFRNGVVAPFVGAWIEIIIPNRIIWVPYCRSLRGSVDWNIDKTRHNFRSSGRSLRGSVDWNFQLTHPFLFLPSRSLRRSIN